MDIHEIRSAVRTKSIYDIPLRVTYYARVSSDSDEQINSLKNQVTYYRDVITKNDKWTFIQGYVDEGISGISTKSRTNFNRMIKDASENKFDLILTKEISRFARNTLDSIQYTRQLLSYGVCVFFQNDNINTLDEDSELRLSIMSSIAQDELRKLSSRVKFGHQQAIKSNVVLGNSRIFGYTKNNGKLIIDESQATMIRELFDLYSSDQYSMKRIEQIFWEKGYRNLNGNKISHSTMANIIANPKYKGYYVGNKVRVVDMFTKKQKFLPEEEWVLFKDETGKIVPAIVSESVWDKANQVLRRRSEDVKNRKGICNHSNLLTGKLFCTHCGRPYYRRESRDRSGNINSKWVCSGKINNGSTSCPSFAIYERELKPILYETFEDTKVDACEMIDEYIKIYKEQIKDKSLSKKLLLLKSKAQNANKKKGALLQLVADGNISGIDFKSMMEECNKEIEAAEAEINELEVSQLSDDELSKKLELIKKTLNEAQKDVANGIITNDFVDNYIEQILVTPLGNCSADLVIKVFTGGTVSKHIEVPNWHRRDVRTGHITKNICPTRKFTVMRVNRSENEHIKKHEYNVFLAI